MIKIGRITLALTVIAIGGVWLLSIWNPALANTLSMYWPLVFVVYGLEVVITSFWKQPRKLSIWLLIVSVVLAFAASSFLGNKSVNWRVIWNLDGIFQNSITEQVDIQQTISQAETVEISVTNGRVEVFPSAKSNIEFIGSAIWREETTNPQLTFKREGTALVIANEDLISLQGKLYIPLEISTLNFTSTNGALQINDNLPKLEVFAETTNGVVEIMSGEQAEITTVNGEVILEDVAIISVTTVNGDVTVSGKIIDAKIVTQQGKVEVESDTLSTTNIRTVNGDVEVQVPKNSALIKAQTVNGAIEIYGQKYEKNILINSNGRNNQMLLETVNGSIEVYE